MDDKYLLIASAGSIRYGYMTKESDNDLFILTTGRSENVVDTDDRIDRFFVSVEDFKSLFGHPLLLGNISGECEGNARLCAFLQKYAQDLIYAMPTQTVRYGLDLIATGERYHYASPIKTGLRTAMILSHMSEARGDPFILSNEEKSILIRARAGSVEPDERVEIYHRTLRLENLDKLRRMQDNLAIKNELFALLDEICKEETP